MPLDSKWATSEPIVEEVAEKKPARSAKKVSTSHRFDSKKKRGSKSAGNEPTLSVGSDTDEYTTDSDWSRPNSGRKSAIFDKGKGRENHGSSSLTENPLAKALGISLDPPAPADREVPTKEPKTRQHQHQQQQSKNSQHSKAPQESANKAKKPNEKKSQALKKRIEEQKKKLEENKRKAEQKELINSLLDGDISFDWEDDESELMEKLKIQEG